MERAAPRVPGHTLNAPGRGRPGFQEFLPRTIRDAPRRNGCVFPVPSGQ
jgi:hypothetical protein